MKWLRIGTSKLLFKPLGCHDSAAFFVHHGRANVCSGYYSAGDGKCAIGYSESCFRLVYTGNWYAYGGDFHWLHVYESVYDKDYLSTKVKSYLRSSLKVGLEDAEYCHTNRSNKMSGMGRNMMTCS